MMDRLREKFGPNYVYREGDEFHLAPEELLQFVKEGFEETEVTVLHDKEN
jgi:hypothetical protein